MARIVFAVGAAAAPAARPGLLENVNVLIGI